MPKYRSSGGGGGDSNRKARRNEDAPYEAEVGEISEENKKSNSSVDHPRRRKNQRQHHRHRDGGNTRTRRNDTSNAHAHARAADAPCMTFDEMNLKPDLLKGVYAYGFEKPSAIQQRAIKPIMIGRDVIAQSQSGTGKTAVFAISSLQLLDAKVKDVQVLVVSPTRELAEQSQRVIQSLGDFMNVSLFVLSDQINLSSSFFSTISVISSFVPFINSFHRTSIPPVIIYSLRFTI